MAGSARSFTASQYACAAAGPWPRSRRSAAPTESRPAGSEVCASRSSVWSAKPGKRQAERIPGETRERGDAAVDCARARPTTPRPLPEASIATAARFTSGIITPKQQRRERQALAAEQAPRDREAHVGVEAERALEAARGERALQLEDPARGQGEQHARHGEARAPRPTSGAGPGEIDLRDGERAEQQRREEHVVDELLQALPEIAPVVEPARRVRGRGGSAGSWAGSRARSPSERHRPCRACCGSRSARCPRARRAAPPGGRGT